MFFKKINPDCEYCRYGRLLSNGEECDCKKYGLIIRKSGCGKFAYDPLKRVPKKAASVEQFTDEDFEINIKPE